MATAAFMVDIPPLPDTTDIAAISPNGKYLAVGFLDSREVRVHKPDGSGIIQTFRDNVERLAVANDGSVIVSGLTCFYSLFTASDEVGFKTGSWVTDVAISATGHRFACGRKDGIFCIRNQDPEYSGVVKERIDSAISCINLSPNGKILAIGTETKAAVIFDIDSTAFTQLVRFESPISRIPVTNQAMASVRTFRKHHIFSASMPLQTLEAAAVSERGYAYIAEDPWLVVEGKRVKLTHTDATKICLSPEENTCVTASKSEIKIWGQEGALRTALPTYGKISHLRVGEKSVAWTDSDDALQWIFF